MPVVLSRDAGVGAAAFLAGWPLGRSRPDAARIAMLVARVWGEETAAADTLGLRNQRSLTLHRALCGGRMEAQVTCPDCATDNEAEVPVAELLDLPDPPEAVVIETDSGPIRFGLPRMAFLAAFAGNRDPIATIAERLMLDGQGTVLSATALARLSAAWEAADPAGAIALGVDCVGCGRQITAAVDPASFVARDFDRLAGRLMAEVDTIARAYGWTEAEILALPADRRRRYLALAGSGGLQGRPV
jgi:hypothetical protein